MRNIFLIVCLFLVVGCSSDKEKIIGVWEINALMVGDKYQFDKGTFEFEEDGIALIKRGETIEKKKWSLKDDVITVGDIKFNYTLKKNRLKMIYKSKLDLYIELIKK